MRDDPPTRPRSTATRRPASARPRIGWALLGALASLALACWSAWPAAGHDFSLTRALLTLPGDGSFRLAMVADLDALALGAPQDADSTLLAERLLALSDAERGRVEADLMRLFERRVRLRFDGEAVPFTVTLPGVGATVGPRAGAAAADDLTALAAGEVGASGGEARPGAGETRPGAGGVEPEASVLGTVVVLDGEVPAAAETVSFFASRAFPPVRLAIVGDGWQTAQLLEKGERGAPLPLTGPAEAPGRWEVAWQYLVLGFEHIVPLGLDHILFVLGLFLLAARLGPLLWQVTAFTAAHTLTLALSTLGVVALPARPVEVAIALSIAYVGIENVFTERLRPWRVAVVFAFGLLHGLGFAGVLAELGLPEGELTTALVAFNVGVELGQLAVIAGAFLLVGWLRRRSWYRRRVVIPLSLVIAAVGLYWALSRAF